MIYFVRWVGKWWSAAVVPSSDSYKSSPDLPKFPKEICISSSEIYKSATDLHKSSGEIHIFLEEIHISFSPTTQPKAVRALEPVFIRKWLFVFGSGRAGQKKVPEQDA